MATSDHSPAERFQAAVTERLQFLRSSLVPVLRQLVEHQYPDEVVSLDFEVFTDGFTQGFPVRAFFIDSENNEYFLSFDGSPEYPSPVDPQLLHIDRVYGDDLEPRFLEEDEDLDTFTLAGEALVPWFAECWRHAGGRAFGRAATVRLHDDPRVFDLARGAWSLR